MSYVNNTPAPATMRRSSDAASTFSALFVGLLVLGFLAHTWESGFWYSNGYNAEPGFDWAVAGSSAVTLLSGLGLALVLMLVWLSYWGPARAASANRNRLAGILGATALAVGVILTVIITLTFVALPAGEALMNLVWSLVFVVIVAIAAALLTLLVQGFRRIFRR